MQAAPQLRSPGRYHVDLWIMDVRVDESRTDHAAGGQVDHLGAGWGGTAGGYGSTGGYGTAGSYGGDPRPVGQQVGGAGGGGDPVGKQAAA